eukprot:CAMPEP_0115019970 /NCGR_PEP_ID=MMETSP0216-20121206/29803_2 /TAXON_ID=223996 /ORGANISM="Protocruzia adherens, Strain Boccale" /LENGTH=122 /DNA_ID=CAMNT_0002391627 /DNA_START=469 /DNA_END=833 /DNA_ORIENTATION=-
MGESCLILLSRSTANLGFNLRYVFFFNIDKKIGNEFVEQVVSSLEGGMDEPQEEQESDNPEEGNQSCDGIKQSESGEKNPVGHPLIFILLRSHGIDGLENGIDELHTQNESSDDTMQEEVHG